MSTLRSVGRYGLSRYARRAERLGSEPCTQSAQPAPRTKEDQEVIITELWVPGTPRTKGSLDERHQDTPQSKTWRRLMAGAVRDDLARRHGTVPGGMSYAGPVEVYVAWFLPVDPLAVRAGDIDKLLRNLLDALSAPTERTTDPSLCGGAIADDNQVQHVDSWEFGPDKRPGAAIYVASVDQHTIDAHRARAERWRRDLTA